MTYAILDIILVALAAGMGITLLILPPSYQECTRIEKYVQVGTILHSELKLHYTPLTKDLSNIVLIDDISKLRENFLYRPQFDFEKLCSNMPFFFNIKTLEIVPVNKFDKIF